MGLDDLGVLKLVLPMLALLLTLFVSGPATLLSYGAWKWSLSELVKGHGLRASRGASVLALVVAGLSAAYTLWVLVLLLVAFPGHLGVAAMLPVLAIVFLALVHGRSEPSPSERWPSSRRSFPGRQQSCLSPRLQYRSHCRQPR